MRGIGSGENRRGFEKNAVKNFLLPVDKLQNKVYNTNQQGKGVLEVKASLTPLPFFAARKCFRRQHTILF